MRIEIVGPGRLGRSLAALLPAAGHTPTLRRRGEAVSHGADLVLLAVPDRTIGEVAARLSPGVPIVHASGATSLDPLAPHPRRGSFHPLMSFPGPAIGLPDLTGVPAAVDANDEALLSCLEALARDLGMQPVRVPGDRRLYHAAAVMAGNLATVLLHEAGRALTAAGVEPAQARAMLAPLAIASTRNAVDDPAGSLTGPVARRDEETLQQHRAALVDAGLLDLLPLYEDGMSRAVRIRDR